MSDSRTVRIGVSAARELEIQVEDPTTVSHDYEKALEDHATVLWIVDARGHRFGVSVASIAFIELEEPEQRGVGFRSDS
jgi:signal recognition particle receptor subunit beta